MFEKQVKEWLVKVQAAEKDLLKRLDERNVPSIRGGFHHNGIAVIEVDMLDDSILALVSEHDSLCVLDWQLPSLPIGDDFDLQDFDVFLRLGSSNTWIHYSIAAPVDERDESNEDEYNGFGYPYIQQRRSVDKKAMQALALKIANATGFGTCRNRKERQDFVDDILEETDEQILKACDPWEITREAETLFNQGVAPTRAKAMSQVGKSVNEIALALGVSKLRAERALGVTILPHISKLLSEY
jgi:hypothetical protein